MKRILPLFLVVLLLTSVICMTAFAGSSYEFPLGDDNMFIVPDSVPSGQYYIKIYSSDYSTLFGYSVVPVHFEIGSQFYTSLPVGDFIYYDFTSSDYYVAPYETNFYAVNDGLSVTFSWCPPDGDKCIVLPAEGTVLVLDDVLASGFSNIVSFDTMSSIFSVLFDLVIGNPLLSALCASSLILVCIPIYTHAKKSVR